MILFICKSNKSFLFLWLCIIIVITFTAQKRKFSIKNFFSKCDQIRRKLVIWSHLLKKYLMENFIFCAVNIYWKHIDVLIFLILLEIAGDFHIDIYLYCIYIIHVHATPTFYFYISFHHIRGFAKSFVHVMSCHLQLNFLPYITERWW